MRKQLIVGFIIPIIFVVLVGVVSYRKAEEGMIQNFESAAYGNLQTKTEFIDYGTSLLASDVMQLSLDDDLSKLTAGIYDSDLLTLGAVEDDLSSSIKVMDATNEFTKGIYIIPNKEKDIISSVGNLGSGFFEEWIVSENGVLLQEKSEGMWIGEHPFIDEQMQLNNQDYAFSYIKLLRNRQACVVIDVSEEFILNSLKSLQLGEGALVAFITEDGNEISCTMDEESTNVIFGELDIFQKEINEESEKQASYQEINGMQYLALQEISTETGGRICALIPKSTVTKEAIEIRTTTIISIIVACVLTIFVSTIVMYNFSSGLLYISKKIKKVAEGDLTVTMDIKGNNELAKFAYEVEHMIDQMRKLIHEVEESSGLVTSASTQVTSISKEIQNEAKEITEVMENIDSGVSGQAEDAQNCMRKMEELSNDMQIISGHVDVSKDAAGQATMLVKTGIATMDKLSNKSLQTADITKQVGVSIAELEKKSLLIKKFVDMINAITEETNLLSLNASIEAARAGSAGRGFAVVAEEIKGLAEDSNNAAKEIQKIVDEILAQTKETATKANEAEVVVDSQEEIVTQTENLFKNIEEHMMKLEDVVKDIRINMSTAEESRIETLGAIENISAVLEETTASVSLVTETTKKQYEVTGELGSAATSLEGEMKKLNVAINQFQI